MRDSDAVERVEARRDGAKLQRNSGRNYDKGDATMGDYLVDYKQTNKGVSVNKDMWAKLCTDSWKEKLKPVLKLIIGEGNQKVRLAVLEWEEFQALVEFKRVATQGIGDHYSI